MAGTTPRTRSGLLAAAVLACMAGVAGAAPLNAPSAQVADPRGAAAPVNTGASLVPAQVPTPAACAKLPVTIDRNLNRTTCSRAECLEGAPTTPMANRCRQSQEGHAPCPSDYYSPTIECLARVQPLRREDCLPLNETARTWGRVACSPNHWCTQTQCTAMSAERCRQHCSSYVNERRTACPEPHVFSPRELCLSRLPRASGGPQPAVPLPR